MTVINPVAVMNTMIADSKYKNAVEHLMAMGESRPMNMIESWREYLTKKGKL